MRILASAAIEEARLAASRIQRVEGRFDATNVRPIAGADWVALSAVVTRICAEKRAGSLYVWLPLLCDDGANYARALRSTGRTWLAHTATSKYCIVRTSFDGDADTVPPAASSIAGAFALIMSPDRRRVLLVETRKPDGSIVRGFPGGAVECGELDVDACVREVREELGLDIGADTMYLIGGYNQEGARTYGKWDDDDAPLVINDHFATFLVFVDPARELRVQRSELAGAAWHSVADVLSGAVAGVYESNVMMLRNATVPEFSGLECKRVKATKVVF